MAYVLNSNDVFRYVWIGRNMNKNYIVAFVSQDEEIILEPLAKFNGDECTLNLKEMREHT